MAKEMTEKELEEAKRWLRRAWYTGGPGGQHVLTEVQTDLLGKLVDAAEENERLRAALKDLTERMASL